MSAGYAPSNVLGNSPQLATGITSSSPFAPGTVFNQSGVVSNGALSNGMVSNGMASPQTLGAFSSQAPPANYSPQTLGTFSSQAAPANYSSQTLGAFPPQAAPSAIYQSQVSGAFPPAASPQMSSGVLPLVAVPLSSNGQYLAPVSSTSMAPPMAVSAMASNGQMLSTSSPRSTSPRASRRRSRSPERTGAPAVEASTSQGLSAAASDLASKLFSRGVVMHDQIIVRDQNGQVAEQFVKGVTKFGDKVLILLDQGQLEAPNVEGVMAASSTIVPYSLKTGVHQCSNSELCGVAFDCQGEICTLVRKNGSLEPREITFKINGAGRYQLPIGVVTVNDAVNAYPVVLWSEFWGSNNFSAMELRAHKLMMLNYIDMVSQRINAFINRSVDNLLEKTVDVAQGLQEKLAIIDRAVFHTDGKGSNGLRQDLDHTVKKLRAFTDGYHKLDTIPADYIELFKTTEVNLYHRKEYQRQLTSLVSTAAGYGDVISNISSQLDGIISQIAQLKSLNDTQLRE